MHLSTVLNAITTTPGGVHSALVLMLICRLCQNTCMKWEGNNSLLFDGIYFHLYSVYVIKWQKPVCYRERPSSSSSLS